MESLRSCKTCSIKKSLDMFGKSKKHKLGRMYSCKSCRNLKQRNYFKENPDKKELARKRVNTYKKNNKEKTKLSCKKYYDKNREKILKKSKEYIKKYPEKRKKVIRNYFLNNRDKYVVQKIKRRMLEKQAIPKWSEKDKIKIVYEKAKWLESVTGLKYHVDHVIPIISENVCGLHVWANLQILEASLNCSKQNKF